MSTAFLPMTVSAQLGYSASPAARLRSPTTLWWRRRSTASPPTLKPISMSTASSNYRDEARRERDGADQDHIGAGVEDERGTDVGRACLAPSIAHPSVVSLHAAIASRACQSEAQRPGHGR